MTILSRCAAAAALCLFAGAAPADQKDSAVFDLTLRGIPTGTLSVSGAIEGRSYAAAGVLKSGGLVALVRKVRYDARVSGRVTNGRFTPVRYEEDADTGKRQSQSVMEYKAGVPQVKVYNPPKTPRPSDIDPATQGGTVDPLTAAFAALRDVAPEEACRLKLVLFDGRRRSQVVLADPQPTGGGRPCLRRRIPAARRLFRQGDGGKEPVSLPHDLCAPARRSAPRGRGGDGHDLWKRPAHSAISRR